MPLEGVAAPGVVVLMFLIMTLCIRYLRQLITADVLEYAAVKSMKDTMRSILSSVALVSALILTIAFACLQVTESARACSNYSFSAGSNSGTPLGVPFLAVPVCSGVF